MKHTYRMLAFVGALTIGGIAYGYKFDFTNGIRGPITVRVKHSGVNEPYYYAVLEGSQTGRIGRSYTFNFEVNGVEALTQEAALKVRGGKKPKTDAQKEAAVKRGDWEYLGRKTGFCLSQISVAPFEWDEKTKKWEMTDDFYDLSPTFVETNYFNSMLKAAASLAEGTVLNTAKLVKAIIKTAAAAGGAPTK